VHFYCGIFQFGKSVFAEFIVTGIEFTAPDVLITFQDNECRGTEKTQILSRQVPQ